MRHRKREKNRRQYTFTRTKAFIALILSAMLSIIFSSVIDAYQGKVYRQGKEKVLDITSSFRGGKAKPKATMNSFPAPKPAVKKEAQSFESLEQRLKRLEKR